MDGFSFMSKSKNKKRKGIDWGNQFINLIVVVLGISIAFYLNNWKEEVDRKNIEQTFLKSLAEDLTIDIASLQLSTDTTRHFIDFLARNTVKIASGESIDSVVYLINSLNVEVPFLPSNNTYLSLIASGDINDINFELRKDIVELYGQNYSYIKLIDESNHKQLSELSRPFLLKELRYNRYGQPNEAILKDPFLINLSYASLYMLESKHALDSTTLIKANELLAKIKKQIK